MVKKPLVALALAIMIVSGAEGADMGSLSNRVFSYRSLETGESLTIDLEHKNIVIGDLVFDIDVCKPSSEYVCIQSKAFDFAVPRDATRLETQSDQVTVVPGGVKGEQPPLPHENWVVGGQNYKLISPLGAQRILGKRMEVVVIQAPHFKDRQKSYVRYYYSPKFGLLGVLILSPAIKYRTLYLLEGSKGFGAQDSENTITQRTRHY